MSLTAKFSHREASVREGGKKVRKTVEWVEVSGFPAGDVVSRRATDVDRQRFKAEYRVFSAPLITKAPVEEVTGGPRGGRLFRKG